MADDKDKTEEGIPTVKQKTMEIDYGQITIPVHPTMQALTKFCALYIGVDENFQILALNDVLVEHQKKFETLKARIYQEVFDREIPKIPEPEPDRSKMTQEEKQALQDQQADYGKKITQLQQKKVELVFPEITITKDSLQNAMDREAKKEKGILINPTDIALLRDFITFI